MEGKRLQEILEATGKPLPQIAELTGLSTDQLKAAFAKADVPTSTIEVLLAALKLPAGFFFGGEQVCSCRRIVADRGPTELPFTPMELDLPLADGEKIRYMAAAIINEHQELDYYPMEKLQQFRWPVGTDTVFFVFRNESDCLIRHFDGHGAGCGRELICDAGYRVGIEAVPSLSLCLYKTREKITETPIRDFDTFGDALYSVWATYRSHLYDER